MCQEKGYKKIILKSLVADPSIFELLISFLNRKNKWHI